MPVYIKDRAGASQEVGKDQLTPEIYRAAFEANLTVPQYVNRQFADKTDVAAYGTPWSQLLATSGLLMAKDRTFGLHPPTMGDVLSGKAELTGASVMESNPASRLLFPAAVLEMVESAIALNRSQDPASFDQMVAMETSVPNARTVQPVIDLSRLDGAKYKAISQLAEPQNMLNITASESNRAIPTTSIGMNISDEALQGTTLDFVAMAVNRVAAISANQRVYDYLLGILNGDTDNGNAALTVTNADVYDTTISADATLTKKALYGWLMHNSYKRTITHIVTDLAGAQLIETALATTNTGVYQIPGMVPTFSVMNRIMSNIQVFICDPAAGWTANTFMGLDKSQAIHRIRNASANYSAVEEFVLSRKKSLRFDMGEICVPIFADAFDVMATINT